jgi:hypothetical protein
MLYVLLIAYNILVYNELPVNGKHHIFLVNTLPQSEQWNVVECLPLNPVAAPINIPGAPNSRPPTILPPAALPTENLFPLHVG